uniref:Uncharacterized protein n=1 Tax=Oryza brachyantha TaxID=4533 RepID=J3NF23_ORYBR
MAISSSINWAGISGFQHAIFGLSSTASCRQELLAPIPIISNRDAASWTRICNSSSSTAGFWTDVAMRLDDGRLTDDPTPGTNATSTMKGRTGQTYHDDETEGIYS